MRVVCEVCPHHCSLEEGQVGFCRARSNQAGRIICQNYGKLTALALDPIEKKPLRHFSPGSLILSAGSYDCNLRCPFCQNSDIAQCDSAGLELLTVSPGELVQKALEVVPTGNIGLAYTYNEPLVGYEFVRDCARLAAENGLKNVVVTNGTICEGPLGELLSFIDAMNIDLKAFSERFYRLAGGDLATVKRTIELAVKACHVEVTTLIVPGENDGEAEMEELSVWLASLSPDLVLHVSRFFPRWQMADRQPTPVDTVYRLAKVARRHLRRVYEGNC